MPRPTSHSAALGPGVTGPSLANPGAGSVGQLASNAVQFPSNGSHPFVVQNGHGKCGNRQHTQDPYVTGTSVLGITFRDGVMIAADTLGSYGSTKRYKNIDRIIKVNGSTLLGAGGELSDFAHIAKLLDELVTEDFVFDDGVQLTAPEAHAYLTRVMYNRRNKFDPLWNSLVVGGLDQTGKPFLGTIGMIGTAYSDQHVATGFGNYLARPLFRERHSPDMTEAEATKLMHDALRVCYYRDKQSINKFKLATVTAAGVKISEPFMLDTNWNYKAFVDPTANAVGAW